MRYRNGFAPRELRGTTLSSVIIFAHSVSCSTAIARTKAPFHVVIPALHLYVAVSPLLFLAPACSRGVRDLSKSMWYERDVV